MAAKQKDNDTRTNAQSPGLESIREERECDNCGLALIADPESGELTCYKCGLIYGDDETAEPAQFHEKPAESRNTPGPWEAWPEGINFAGYRIWSVIANESAVAQVYTYGEGDQPGRTEATARLIAAAPDLLAQLKALCVQIESAGMIVPPGSRNAIAKAEGSA